MEVVDVISNKVEQAERPIGIKCRCGAELQRCILPGVGIIWSCPKCLPFLRSDREVRA